jgi:predicted oxidoreductase
MKRIRLHSNGPEVSRIAAGMWRLDGWDLRGERLAGWIEEAVDLGVTTFDHADIYGGYVCEGIFGEALALRPGLRDRIELVTKCGIQLPIDNNPGCTVKHYDTSRKHILESVERSLNNLNTDRIDLLLIHRPDPFMDPDETAGAFTSLRESGKVLHFGVSNFTSSQFEMLQSRLPFPLVTDQVEISVLHTDAFDDGTVEFCQTRRISPMAWSPLAGGELFTADDERTVRVRSELEAVCSENGIGSIARLALAWLLAHPAGIVPVTGTGRIERIRSEVAAAEIELSRQDWFRILKASKGTDVP